MLVFSACYNVSASVTEHRFENLTPGSKYNISLAAATGAGEGPRVFRIVNTLPENHVTGNDLKRRSVTGTTVQPHHKYPPVPPSSAAVGPEWAVCDAFDLNDVHLHAEAVSDPFIELLCARWTCISHTSPPDLKFRIKQKIFPPVPKPVILDFTHYQAQVRSNYRQFFLPVC